MAGGEEEVDVVVANLSPDAAGSARGAASPRRLRGVGDRVELRVAEKAVNDALRLALDTGGEVISVSPHRVSLESFFLAAVEDGDAEEQR